MRRLSIPRKRFGATPKRLRALILPISLLLALDCAQVIAEEGFQGIEVGRAPAGEVAAWIERALTIQGQTAEVVVDAPRHRLLVRGTKAAQERARELVAALARKSTQPSQPSNQAPAAAVGQPAHLLHRAPTPTARHRPCSLTIPCRP